ncbi:hypothetical protein NUACC26_077640 [Scytonema sp. NUACC26]
MYALKRNYEHFIFFRLNYLQQFSSKSTILCSCGTGVLARSQQESGRGRPLHFMPPVLNKKAGGDARSTSCRPFSTKKWARTPAPLHATRSQQESGRGRPLHFMPPVLNKKVGEDARSTSCRPFSTRKRAGTPAPLHAARSQQESGRGRPLHFMRSIKLKIVALPTLQFLFSNN